MPRRSPQRPSGLVEDLLLNALPGLLAGTQLAGLLFFLNPRLEFAPGPFLRACLLCGGLLAVASALLLTPLTRMAPGRARRLLPWLLTAVLTAAAIGDWVHAARYSFFIPPGVNARLIKAALWLTAGALVSFYTALLYTLQMRPYGARSRIWLTAVAILSVVVLAERREAYRPEVLPPPLPSVVEPEPRPSLVVIGLEGATLDAVLPLARQGQLPFFARLLEEGSYGRLKTLEPRSSIALWTTLATGRLPYGHGVLTESVYPAGFLEQGSILRLLPMGAEVDLPLLRPLPAGAAARQALPAWEIASRLGIASGVAGWPGTYGTSAPLEFAFSDRYFNGLVAGASATPPELAERGLLFRVATEEIDPAVASAFGDAVPHELLRALSHDLWRESLGAFLLDQKRDTRAAFVMLPGLGTVSRRYYGGFSTVRFGGSTTAEQLAAAALVTAYYRHLDGFLSRLVQRLPEPRIVAVVSAHGVSAPSGWRRVWNEIRRRPLKGRFDGAPDGVLLLAGEGIRRGVFLEEARLIDVLPTLLYALRMPIARDLDGSVLTAAFERTFLARNPLTFVPSYETLATE